MYDFHVIEEAASRTDTVILMFSGGKDSIACLEMCVRHFKRVVPVYLYFVPGLEYKNRHFDHFAKRFGVTVHQFPRAEDIARQMRAGAYQLNAGKKVPKVRQWEMDTFLRREFDIPWIVYGYKRADSLQRRGIINANCTDLAGNRQYTGGVDLRNKKIYPLANWSGREVTVYIKKKRLPLPPDYGSGFRDINTFKGDALLWLYNNYPADYERVKQQYPLIEAALMRAKDGTTWGKK